MPDIWSGIGAEISQSKEGEWLYQVRGQVRGPVPTAALAQKLVSGELGVDTLVGKEGGDFHPVARVAAFSTYITEAKKQASKRAAKKMRRILAIIAVPVLAALGGGAFLLYKEAEERRVARVAEDKRKGEELERMRRDAKAVEKMELVALVSLGSEDSVKIKQQQPSGAKPAKEKPGRKGRDTVAEKVDKEEDTMVQQCQLSQADIFGTLKRNLAKINVCVEEEKKTDTQGLMPATLELSFVVQTSGKVVEFEIEDRHYRKGPLNNCMTKVFNSISFPSSSGANCPVSIPIKIGK